MQTDWNLIALEDLGALRVRGADAVRFLQGQVSNDVARLTPQHSLLAGYHNPQGRTIALLRLVLLEQDDLLAILPRELAATVASRLSKFILRARVKIADESAGWRIAGLVAPGTSGGGSRASAVESGGGAMGSGTSGAGSGTPDSAAAASRAANWAAAQFERTSARVALQARGDAGTSAAMGLNEGASSSAAAQLDVADATISLPDASALMLPDSVGSQSRVDNSVIVRVGAAPPRWLVVSPAEAAPLLSAVAPADRESWRLLDIAAGEPQVYAATSEEFVAQMLNLDALDAIAFDKGCYTGQEVIARAHYRGRVKRRLQRFVSRGTLRLAAGDSGQLADGRAFKVVEAAQLAEGRCEFLAVAPMASGDHEPRDTQSTAPPNAVATDGTGSKVASPPGTGAGSATTLAQGVPVDAEQLPLSYALDQTQSL